MRLAYSIAELFKTSWEELSPTEMYLLISASDQMNQSPSGGERYGAALIQVLRILRKNRRAVAKLSLEQAVDVFNDLAFFKRDSAGNFVAPWLYFPIKDFKVKGHVFRRPEMNGNLPMYDRMFDQLVYADSAFSQFCVLNYQYQQAPSQSLLREMGLSVDALIATLYQAPHQFDVIRLEETATLVGADMPIGHKAIILHSYANVRAFLMNRCYNLFPQPATQQREETTPNPPQQTGELWMNLRYDLAETDVFRGFETARRALIYDALDYLDKRAKENLNSRGARQ